MPARSCPAVLAHLLSNSSLDIAVPPATGNPVLPAVADGSSEEGFGEGGGRVAADATPVPAAANDADAGGAGSSGGSAEETAVEGGEGTASPMVPSTILVGVDGAPGTLSSAERGLSGTFGGGSSSPGALSSDGLRKRPAQARPAANS